jgi:rRNA-processing protein FCF1
MKVVLDSNFLLLPFETGIDIFRGAEKLVDGKAQFVVFKESLGELSSSRKKRMQAAAISEALRKEGAEILEEKGKVDDMIFEYAAKNSGGVAVCTEDRALQRRLRDAGGVQLIYSKERSHLATDWQRGD